MIGGKVMHLEDGSTICAKVNMATLYYMAEREKDAYGHELAGTDLMSIMAISDKADKNEKATENGEPLPFPDVEPVSDQFKIRMAAKLVYVLLRSNGRRVDFEEALVLMPIDIYEGSEFMEVFEDFKNKLEDFQKKAKARQASREHLMNSLT
jgi:hypothetical protein